MDVVIENVRKTSWWLGWAAAWVLMGVVFIIIYPHPAVILVVGIVSASMAVMYLWEGFHRTPDAVALMDQGIELRFKSGKARFIAWDDIEKVEIPPNDPSTFYGKHLVMGNVFIRGERKPVFLTIESTKTILERKGEGTGECRHDLRSV